MQLDFACMNVKIKLLQRRHVLNLETTHWKLESTYSAHDYVKIAGKLE